MTKNNKFPTSQQLNKWEREMKAACLWPEKIQTINFKNPKIKPRKLGAVANTASVRPVSQGQNMDIKDLMAGTKVHITPKWDI